MSWIDYFVNKRMAKLASENASRQHCFRSLKEAHDILIFYEAKSEKEIEPCLETLRMLKKNVQVCVYVANKFFRNERESYLYIYQGKNINFLGYPTPATQKRVNELKADVLIDLSGKNCYPIKHLMLRHPSCFKIGLKRSPDEQDLYDFSLSVTERDDMMYLFGQIIFYLQTIRSK